MKILVTRTDRLGDVVLATPVLKRIREFYPQAQLSFLVQKSWMPILQYGPEVRLIEYDPQESVLMLAEKLKAQKFDSAVVIRDEKKVSQAVFRAGIPLRVGPYSSLRSFLFFNQGKVQKRSQCKMHEAEYSLSLLTKIGIPFQGIAERASDLPPAWVATNAKAEGAVQSWLMQASLSPQKYVCVHPGSSGSARYVSSASLIEVMKALIKKGHSMVLTGGPQEKALLEQYALQVPQVKIFSLSGLDELAELYRNAQWVVAHGTGPLHLAAAVGAPVYAIFPPLFVLSEKRWGPLTARRYVWTPPKVNCPEKYQCRGPKCAYYDCMGRFETQTALSQMESLISNR